MKKTLYIFLLLILYIPNVFSEEILFTEPVIVGQTAFDYSESQNSPNFSFENNQYLLTYHINGIHGSNIISKYLNSEPQFNTTAEYFLCDTSLAVMFPTLQEIEAKKLFYYYDLSINEPTNDTLYSQKLMLFDGESPTEDDHYNAKTFYTQTKSNLKEPQFNKASDRIYAEMLKNQTTVTDNNKIEYFLRSVNSNNSELFPPILHYSANGRTAMVPFGDSLLTVKSWVFCTDYQNLSCINWAVGYKGYVVYENKIVYIHSLSEKDISDIKQQPDDVYSGSFNSDYIFALRQSKQLMRINYETMRFEEVLNLSNYTTGSYKKIIPLQTLNYAVVFLIDNDNNVTIMRFDPLFQFVDSISIPFEGEVTEISDFVYDQSKDLVSYAYATKLNENSSQTRIFLQSAIFDKSLVQNPPSELPNQFTVLQNYPNPFNPSTKINYALPKDGHLTVDIFNMLGQKVSTLYDQVQTAGEHFVEWNANNQSSGLYLVKMTFGNESKSIKTMLLK